MPHICYCFSIGVSQYSWGRIKLWTVSIVGCGRWPGWSGGCR